MPLNPPGRFHRIYATDRSRYVQPQGRYTGGAEEARLGWSPNMTCKYMIVIALY